VEEIIYHIGGAAVAGALYGIVAYFKNKKQEDFFKGFDKVSFFTGVAGSAVIGGIAAYTGTTPDVISSSTLGPFVFQFVRKVIKSFIKA